MEKAIAKGRMFGVTVAYNAEQIARMQAAPEFVETVMQGVAFMWHGEILPEHFTREAHGKYGYAQRTRGYLKKRGNRPDLVNSGSMKAELLRQAAVKKASGGVQLKMQGRAMNFVPNSANPFDTKIKNSRGNWYPNMKREVRLVTEAEQKGMALQATTHLAALFSGSGSADGDPNGGEVAGAAQRQNRTGSRGGRYFIGSTGRKVYIKRS